MDSLQVSHNDSKNFLYNFNGKMYQKLPRNESEKASFSKRG